MILVSLFAGQNPFRESRARLIMDLGTQKLL